MGTEGDATAVVALRVFGVERPRVVDASVMPGMLGGNVNAPVILIAGRRPI
jgi:choline dehydrogenase-like flavoprotein